MDLHRRQPIWLQSVRCATHLNAQRTMWECQIIMLEIHQAKTLNPAYPRTDFNHLRGIVTCLCSYHSQVLTSSTTLPHAAWHQARNQAQVQPKDIRVMGHRGKDTTSTQEVMVDLKCSPLSNSQDGGRHLWVHLECLQHCLATIQLVGGHLPPLLHTKNYTAHLGDHPLATQPKNFTRRRNHTGQRLQGLWRCPHYQRFLITNCTQNERAMIRRTWVGPKAKPQSAWGKRTSPWRNLAQGWGSPTLVHSTSGRKYLWLGFWRTSIGPICRDRTFCNSCVMDPCTGRRQLQMLWRLSKPGCLGKRLILPNWFADSGLRWFGRNVQVRFGKRERCEGEPASDWQGVWESVWATKQYVKPQIAKFNFHGCDSSSAKRQEWPDI